MDGPFKRWWTSLTVTTGSFIACVCVGAPLLLLAVVGLVAGMQGFIVLFDMTSGWTG